jgi:hypothetical protein
MSKNTSTVSHAINTYYINVLRDFYLAAGGPEPFIALSTAIDPDIEAVMKAAARTLAVRRLNAKIQQLEK